ncbi:hypothetical protein GW17_00023911 [Ensete ventricosum]|nr:hypothetical protein GW17_00023911 [Ensete ventricosum]
MRLRLQCIELDKEPEEPEIDPIDLQFYNEDSEPMLEWVEAVENQEDPLLDEAKKKSVVSVAPLERIESGDETSLQSHLATRSVQRHGNNMDNSASTDDGSNAEESLVPST